MIRNIIALVLILDLLAGCAGYSGGDSSDPTAEETTLTKVGQMAPDFSVNDLDGQPFTLSQQKGKVVLINWFATWCPPCKEEMPHFQKEVWEIFGANPEFAMISVAREETAEVVAPFVEEFAVTWPFVLDPDRVAYARYAEAFIPRNHVVNRQGEIIFQSNGFERADFDEMIEVIHAELAP